MVSKTLPSRCRVRHLKKQLVEVMDTDMVTAMVTDMDTAMDTAMLIEEGMHYLKCTWDNQYHMETCNQSIKTTYNIFISIKTILLTLYAYLGKILLSF